MDKPIDEGCGDLGSRKGDHRRKSNNENRRGGKVSLGLRKYEPSITEEDVSGTS